MLPWWQAAVFVIPSTSSYWSPLPTAEYSWGQNYTSVFCPPWLHSYFLKLCVLRVRPSSTSFVFFFFCDDYTPNINHLFYRRFPSTPNAKAPRCLVSRSGDFLGLCPHSADICGDFIFHTSVSDKEQVVLWDFSFEFNSGLWTHLLLVFPSRPLFQIVWLSW